MATIEEIFRDAMALPPDVRTELTERLIASLNEDISPEITRAQLAEVRRRIAQVESGEAAVISGDEALAGVRNLLAEKEDEGVAEALRRDAEIEADPSQAISLVELKSHVRNRRG